MTAGNTTVSKEAKGSNMNKKFTVNDNNKEEALSGALVFIHESLEAMKHSKKDANYAELMCEEALVNLMNHADFTRRNTFSVNVRRSFGDVVMDFAVPGAEFDFAGDLGSFEGDDDISPEAEASIRSLLLRSFGNRITYRNTRGWNIAKVRAFRSSYSMLWKTLTALILAVISGLLACEFAPESAYMAVNDNFLVLVRDIFMNGLKMCSVPIVFLSLVSCLGDAGGLGGMKSSGSKMLKYSVMIQVIVTVMAFALIWLLGTGTGINVTEDAGVAVQSQGASFSFRAILAGLMPANFVRPFLDGDMIQLLVLAVLMGVAVGMSGVKSAKILFSDLNSIFMKVTEILLHMIPLVVFCSIASLIITTGAETMMTLAGILGALVLGYMLMLAVYGVLVQLIGGLNPVTFFRKCLPVITTAFTTCSGVATLPENLKCAKALGISQKVYSIALPLGVSLIKPAGVFYGAAMVMISANIYGMSLTISKILILGVSVIILSSIIPSIPGGSVIVISALLSQAGLPMGIIGLAISIEAVQDMFNTVATSMGSMTSVLLAAKEQKMIDLDEYNRP